MSVQKTRFVRLSGITMPLRFEHGHLAASERIDEAASRIDTLAISLYVEYQSPLPIIPCSMPRLCKLALVSPTKRCNYGTQQFRRTGLALLSDTHDWPCERERLRVPAGTERLSGTLVSATIR